MPHKHFEGTKINYLKKENGRFFFFFFQKLNFVNLTKLNIFVEQTFINLTKI